MRYLLHAKIREIKAIKMCRRHIRCFHFFRRYFPHKLSRNIWRKKINSSEDIMCRSEIHTGKGNKGGPAPFYNVGHSQVEL